MTQEEFTALRKAWTESDDMRDHGLTESPELDIYRDIPYLPDGNPAHLLDIYRPKGDTGLPVLLSVHGGAWFYGDKQRYRFYCMHMAELGFVVVNCNYRLMPEYLYPAPLEDICAVVRWMEANISMYTTSKSWFLTGDSAGAQLAAQYCIAAANPVYREQLCFSACSSLPDAVALNCGIYDMQSLHMDFKVHYTQKTDPQQLALLEHMLDYVNDRFPSTYLMLSVNDGLHIHTAPMKARLEACGIPLVYREFGEGVPADDHVFHLNLHSENGKRCNAETADFFRAHVHK